MQYEPIQPELSELLSAYLDGEVTVEEQESIERRLHTNAEFRQLYDELRAVQVGLESLPRLKLEKNFASIVLRRAERAILSAAISSEPDPAAAKEQVSLPEPPIHSRRSAAGARRPPLLPRYLQWSIPAMAAALLFMIFNPFVNREIPPVGGTKPPAEAGVAKALAPINEAVTRIAQSEKKKSSEIGESANALKPPVEDVKTKVADVGVPYGPGWNQSLAREIKKAVNEGVSPAMQQLLVVQCDVTAEAIHSGMFERLLSENHVTLAEGANQLRLDSTDSKSTEVDAAVAAEGFMIETSPAQIDALVAGLKAARDQVPSVTFQAVAVNVTGMPAHDYQGISEPRGAAMRVVIADYERLKKLIPTAAVASGLADARSGKVHEKSAEGSRSQITAVLDTSASRSRGAIPAGNRRVAEVAPTGTARTLLIFRVVPETKNSP